MATAGELRGQLAYAIMKGGEAWQSLQQCVEYLGAATEAAHEAYTMCSQTADQGNGPVSDSAQSAMAQYIDAHNKILGLMGLLQEAQDSLGGGGDTAGNAMAFL